MFEGRHKAKDGHMFPTEIGANYFEYDGRGYNLALIRDFTERKQAPHDMVCDTLVVDKWAFTDHPERQQQGLGTVTVVVLVLFGLFLLGILALGLAMVAMIGSMGF